jgi:hypothetical protein
MMRRDDRRTRLAAHVTAVLAISVCGGLGATGAEKPGEALVGSWEREAGKVAVYQSDGTGKNPDGSRFRWELKEGSLIARSLAADGKPGEEWSVPVAFTRDRKEFTFYLARVYRVFSRNTFFTTT